MGVQHRPAETRTPSTTAVPAALYRGEDLNPNPVFARSDLLLIGALTVIAALLRLPGLDYGLWYDEIWTLLNFVRLPAAEIVTSAEQLNNHVLYSLGAHFTTSLFGESTWALRLPAMVFGVLTVPAMYYLGLQLSSKQESLLATAFLVFSYHHVWFSQNARGYSGVALGMVIASILFIRLITTPEPRGRQLAAYAVVAALTAWLNLVGALIILVHGLTWLGLAHGPVRERCFRKALPSAAALVSSGFLVLLLYLPILSEMIAVFSVGNVVATAQYEWDSGLWTLGEFLNGVTRALPGGWIAVVVVVATLLAGVAGILQRGKVVPGLVLFPLLVPLAAALVAQNVFFPRFVVSALPFILFVGVAGGFKLASLVTPFLSRTQVSLAGLVVVLMTGTQVPHAWSPKQDFAGAASFIEDNRQTNTAFLCLDLSYMPMVDYLQTDCLPVDSVDTLERIEAVHEKTYLLYTLPIRAKFLFPGIIDHLEANYTLTRVFPGTLGGGDITIMSRDNPGDQPGQ